MKKLMIAALALVFGLCVTGNALASDKEVCEQVCKDAATMIKADINAAKAEINKKDGKFVKGSIYVFAMNMKGDMIAHPMKASLIGKNLIDQKDKNGKAFFKDFVELAKSKGSGWVDYMWPKPGEEAPSAKSSYILKVTDDVLVGAGYYK
ncbi:cache domain-containing protein [Desulfonema magnum]|uniref:Double Cache 2 domain-containing protein n=1 Tax=Desulfonema magnum TaxID=45655 RepID=A0A975BMP2_9BACT|nr:cache domain-containing protein [Desulfonema magnum]QTA88296.1 Double Cache 2 domain-containing protein [Desulfonema magnum]